MMCGYPVYSIAHHERESKIDSTKYKEKELNMNIKSTLILATMGFALIACDDDSSPSSTAASTNTPKKRIKLAYKNDIKGSTKAQQAQAPKAEATPAAPAMETLNVVAVEKIANYSSDPYAGMDAISEDTIQNRSSRYTYAGNGYEYALARVDTMINGEKENVWTVLMNKGSFGYAVPSTTEVQTLIDTLNKDQSKNAKRFAAQLVRRDIAVENESDESLSVSATLSETLAQVTAGAATPVTGAVYAPAAYNVRVYDAARIVGFHSGGETLELTSGHGVTFQSQDGNTYAIASVKTDEDVSTFFGLGSYKKSIFVLVQIVPNLFRSEYAPVYSGQRLYDELVAAKDGEDAARAYQAENFLRALELRNIDLSNAAESTSIDSLLVDRVVAPASN